MSVTINVFETVNGTRNQLGKINVTRAGSSRVSDKDDLPEDFEELLGRITEIMSKNGVDDSDRVESLDTILNCMGLETESNGDTFDIDVEF